MTVNYWVWPVIRENWKKIVKSRRVRVMRGGGVVGKSRRGNKIVFYVKGTKPFRGLFEVEGYCDFY